MSRARAAVLAVAFFGAAILSVHAAPESFRAAGWPSAGPQQSLCIVANDIVAAPPVLLLGETVDITLTAVLHCPPVDRLHVALVLDASASMAGDRTRVMKEAAIDIIMRLDLDHNPQTQVSVVQFNDLARTLCRATNQTGRAVGCVQAVPAGGGGRIDLGILEAFKELRLGRSRASDRDALREVMVVFADDPNDTGCPPVLAAAATVKGQSVRLISVGIGPDCDVPCMQQAATTPSYHLDIAQAGSLDTLFRLIAGTGARELVITEELPANMRYIPDSSDGAWDENLRTLTWRTSPLGPEGITHTFRVEPLELGRWPVSVRGTGAFRDYRGVSGAFTFGSPEVTVLDPNGLPTPSGSAPPPTASPTPSVTPSPTPRSGQSFLPLLRVTR